MPTTSYGNFHDFCRDSTLPACNLFNEFKNLTSDQIGGYGGCELRGIPLGGDRYLQNLGVIIIAGIAILTTLVLLWLAERKRAAVGRREMQLFLIGYLLVSICEIFTIGGFPLPERIRIGFTGAHIGLITATCWILMLNGAVGYQIVDDGTVASISLILGSAGAILIGTGYVALDIGYGWSGYWAVDIVQNPPFNRSYALYTLYFLGPLLFLFIYFWLQAFVILKILGEFKPLLWLVLAILFFAIGQIFDFVISVHICNGVAGKIDGSLFQTFFTLLAVGMLYALWDSITEDSWPTEELHTDVHTETAEYQASSLHSPARTTANIPPPRQPANIPLHTLSHPTRHEHEQISSPATDSASDNDEKRLRGRRGSQDSDSADSDFSLWSDTGDLVDQLADEEDPLRARSSGQEVDEARTSLTGRSGRRKRGKRNRRVNFAQDDGLSDKEGRLAAVPERPEDIPVPNPTRNPASLGERLVALVLAPMNSRARIHGLYGTKLVYFTTVFVSLGVFLFGYDQGVMSGIITILHRGPDFKDAFNQPSRAEIGTMVAILEVGALVASLVVGKIGDVIGRKRTVYWGSIIFVVGGALQTFANGMPMMVIGRVIAGLGVGTLSTIVPVYQSEISPAHNRGLMGCIEFSGNILGYAASVWVDYGCSFINNDWSWRMPLFMQVFMGALLAVGSLVIPESPRWLLDNDHDEEGIVVIANLYGEGDIHNAKSRDEYRLIKMNVLVQRQEGERGYIDMFRRYTKRVFIACSAQALAQLNGINVISYYAPLVFESAGWVGRGAILMTGINAITYLLSTVPPWYLVDRWGRRIILLSGAIAMCVSLCLVSYFIYIDIKATPTLVVVFVMIYNASFGASWGPIPWLYPPEILPLSIRAKGASLSTASNWAFNWLVGEMTPILQDLIKWRLYLVHAFFCAMSFVVVYFIYPETANVALEDMNMLFGDATSQMPTPASRAESSAMGASSPVPSLHLGQHGPDSAIPGLDIDPPELATSNGKPVLARQGSEKRDGVGGWISRMVRRGRSGGQDDGQSGAYSRVGQNDD